MATLRLCSIPDCGKRHKAHGLCHTHYVRMRKYGDPLKKSTTPGAASDWLIEIANYEGDECREWPFSRSGNGYAQVATVDRTFFAHRLLCEMVNGPAPTAMHQAAHSCGNRLCLTPRHLRWATPTENHADKYLHGTDGRGERNSQAKLTEDDIRFIRRNRGKISNLQLADMFGLHPVYISNIHRRKTWSWLQD